MENASKALLIAAGVLVAIITVTIGIKIYTSTSGTDKIASKVGSDVSQKTGEASDLAVSEITNSNIPKGLKVGDTVYYDHTNGNTNTEVTQYAGGWQVLSISDNRIKLISSNIIGTKYMYGHNINNYNDVILELNTICDKYGHGKGAESGRSVNIDDINNITGYKNTNTVTYTFYWDGSEYPYYETSDGKTGNLSRSHKSSGFYYFEDNVIKNSKMPENATSENKIKITTINKTGYYYMPSLNKDSKEYLMLFNSGMEYILATYQSYVDNYCAEYGLFTINNFNNSVQPNGWIRSNSRTVSSNPGIRAVVTLSPNTKLKGSSTQGWTIQ